MNIDKAIEIKERQGEEFLNTDPDEIDEAEKLSIEALKRLESMRTTSYYKPRELLPGETEVVHLRSPRVRRDSV